jgi:phosphohistidine phosphatase
VIPEFPRRLVLVRHAKAARPSGVPDHERPLCGKGRRSAQAVGHWFVAEGPRPGLALCSTAVRCRQTWEIACGSLAIVPTRYESALYEATPEDVLRLVRAVNPDLPAVVVIGHEPTMSEVALTLAGPGSEAPALEGVTRSFRTAGVAVLRLSRPWGRLEAGSAALESYVVPRG